MGERENSFCEKGLVLTLDEFAEFVKLNKDSLIKNGILDKEDFENADYFELACYLSSDCLSVQNISYYGDITSGDLYDLYNTKYLREIPETNDIVVFYLKKGNLFNSYKDIDEIYNELRETLKNNGFENIDDKFLKEKTGILYGSYWG